MANGPSRAAGVFVCLLASVFVWVSLLIQPILSLKKNEANEAIKWSHLSPWQKFEG